VQVQNYDEIAMLSNDVKPFLCVMNLYFSCHAVTLILLVTTVFLRIAKPIFMSKFSLLNEFYVSVRFASVACL
jgi:hypothetical protein